MGMFDYIEVDKNIDLDIPYDGLDPSKLEFQTKCLDKTLSTYVLRKDGLYLLTEENKLQNINFHGVLDFGAYYDTDLVDYVLDFKAKYTDGLLVDLYSHRSQEFFHESKKERIKALVERQKKNESRFFLPLLARIFGFFGIDLKQSGIGHLAGKKYSISFFCPKLVFLFSKDGMFKDYGLYLERVDTGVKFSSCSYEFAIHIKILGFGFVFKRYKIDLLEALSKHEK